MKGRLEHNLSNENAIKTILVDVPPYLNEYYYSFKQGRMPSACLDYLRNIKKYLRFVSEAKGIRVQDLDVEDVASSQTISEYMDSIKTKIVDGEQVETSISIQQKNHTVLNSFFTFLCDNDYIDKNPMRNIRRRKGKDNINRKFLKEDDLRAILDQVDKGIGSELQRKRREIWKSRDKAILMIFMETGIRETALTEINIEDVDIESGTITVVNKGYKPYVYKIDSVLIDVIADWMYDRTKILGNTDRDALFITESRGRISRSTIIRLVKDYSAAALGYQVSPHKLRAAFANMILRNSNGNIYLVQRMLDHSSPNTTKIYLDDITEKDKENVANTVSNLIFQ